MTCVSDTELAKNQGTAVFTEQAVANYADRVGAQGGTDNWVRCLAIMCLRANRILYFKKQPGDCGTASSNPQNVGLALAQAGIKAGLGAVPLVGGLLQAVANFLPFAHHAQAVANEQATICDVTLNWSGFADAMEKALGDRTVALQDALTQLDKLHA